VKFADRGDHSGATGLPFTPPIVSHGSVRIRQERIPRCGPAFMRTTYARAVPEDFPAIIPPARLKFSVVSSGFQPGMTTPIPKGRKSMNIQRFSVVRFGASAGFFETLSSDALFRRLALPEVNP
jgi:hypothetical protein